MMGSWAVLQHVAWEVPGLIATEAEARGLIDIRRLDLGASIPRLDEVAGLVVMGGPMGVYETDKHPFLARECTLIRDSVLHDRPVLGVCLGAVARESAGGKGVSRTWAGNRLWVCPVDCGRKSIPLPCAAFHALLGTALLRQSGKRLSHNQRASASRFLSTDGRRPRSGQRISQFSAFPRVQ